MKSKLNYITYELIIVQIFFMLLPLSLSANVCFTFCKTCKEKSSDYQDMKCNSCMDNYYFIYNTSNCGLIKEHKNYYLNKTDSILYPCSLFPLTNCYECNPYLNTSGICLTCEQGFVKNPETNECIKCNESEYPVIINGFTRCTNFNDGFCDSYYTRCLPLINDTVTCPDSAPIYNKINKSCHEFECKKNGFEKGVCSVENPKYKNRILFINWFDNDNKYCRFPSYNIDNSGYLLIELNCGVLYCPHFYYNTKTKERKLYFFNEEGRGLFNEIDDIYQKNIKFQKGFMRQFSTSTLLKMNNSEEKRYFLNFECSDENLEFFDIKTGEISTDNLFDVFLIAGHYKVE